MARTATERYSDCKRLVEVALAQDPDKLVVECDAFLRAELAQEPPSAAEPRLNAGMSVAYFLATFAATICMSAAPDAPGELLTAAADSIAIEGMRRQEFPDANDGA